MLDVVDVGVGTHPPTVAGQRPRAITANPASVCGEIRQVDREAFLTDRSNAAARADAPLTRAEALRLAHGRVAVLGEIRDEGQPLSPWAVVIRIRGGLIIESRSYLSDEDLLDRLGVLR